MRIHVRFFALLRDKAGTSQAELELSGGATVGAAVAEIAKHYPMLASPLRTAACAVNRSYARPDIVLNDGDELALIPPVSGG
jgi:molybdopterin converting factor subunit 1